MICFVDIEHERILQSPQSRNRHLAACMDVQLKLQALAGVPCLVQRYTEVTRRRLRDLNVRALLISGNAADWAEYDPGAWTELHRIIRDADLPMIGFCGGHQLIAMAHNAPLGPIRPLRPGEPDVTTLSAPGYFKEWGFTPIRLLRDDPLFAGLDRATCFLEVHYWEIKAPPAGFEVLAASDDCAIQAIRQIGRPVYGTQFHPEGFCEGPHDFRSSLVQLVYPDGCPEPRIEGRIVLTNFFRIAGLLD